MMMGPLDKELANRAYNVLVGICGADEADRNSFIFAVTKPTPTTEYRFCGYLGFGGKFRPQRMTVDCYPEDLTPSRQVVIDQANKALGELPPAVTEGGR